MKTDETTRKCIVTGEVLPKAELLRFTLSPENIVLPDFKKKLPGRGLWVCNAKSLLKKAIEKKLFSKAAQKSVKADEKLLETVELLLKKKALNAVSLARKAGVFVTGFEKTAEKIKNGRALFVLEAKDAGTDGRKKIEAMAKNLKIFNSFTSEELDQELNKVSTVYAVFEKSKMSQAVYTELVRYENFINL